MNRHVLIGRLGNDDKFSVPVAKDEVETRLDLVTATKRLDYGIGQAMDDLARIHIFPTEIGLDLLILAAHVHAADTRISRATESQDTWTREIRLVVPVSDLPRWVAVTSALERTLNFLTGDRWLIGFRKRPARFSSCVKTKPLITKKPIFDAISLFSGGLDSLIGVIDLLESGTKPLLVSHAGEGATSDSQNRLFAGLRKGYKTSSFDRLRIWMNFPTSLVEGVGTEDTTRGRSFLFFAAGVFAGTGMGQPFTLRVPENGLIALNVPLDSLRLGSLSTRTTHPFYMARWNDLLEALGIPGRVENPYWDKTKGEMVAACANRTLLKELIPESLSCSSPTKARWLGHGIEHCGYCLPCLIRRASIRKALGSDPSIYTLADLSAQTLTTLKAEGQQVRSFQLAIARLHKNPQLASVLIHKGGPLSGTTAAQMDSLADVYSRGMEEVAYLLNNVIASPN